ncbi:archaeosortase/exosortase family protein [Rhodococcus sp. CH91]|uniref:archaeosortase/exosortase family protein n=1 Tax=Rhodococcus sp. CH91 TaxID=2910256 RepID=UPI001F4AB9F4|nr:archaeosortase/exosortase family protein [Rhodococcus sp. CH91]
MTATLERPAFTERLFTRGLRDTTIRWIVIVAATLIAFHSTWLQLIDEIRASTTGGYVLIVPPLVAVVALGVTRRRRNELPIHDRQTDIITSVLLLLIALAIKALLMPRYATNYQAMHLDVLAAWVFVCGACVALFGLRVTAAYWEAWMMLFLSSPIVYRIVLVELGGTKFVAGAVTLVLAASAIGLAVRRNRWRGFRYGTATFVVGLVVLVVIDRRWPDAPIAVDQYVPALVSTVTVGSGAYLWTFRGLAPRTLPRNPVSASQAARGALCVSVAALLAAFVPLPDQRLTPVSVGPPYSGSTTQIVPPGWVQLSSVDYDWPRAYFRQNSVLRRQMIRAEEPNPEWDRLLRPRTIAVQTLQVRRVGSFAVYPSESMYELGKSRVSPKEYVDLGRGVTAEYFTVVDDKLLLTWSMLSFVWTRSEDVAQRVSLLTVDNHEFDAPFPQPEPNTVANVRTLMRVLLRGNGTVEDTDPEFKDRSMLIDVGRELVEAQWQGA